MQNFGQINETFKNILVDSIITKDDNGKKIFKAYVKALKENSVLRTQYDVYNKLESKVNEENQPEHNAMFVDECISVLQKLGKDKINETNNNLVKFLKKYGYDVYGDDYEFKTLHEHIINAAFLERNAKNVNKVIESKLFLKEHSKVTENVSVKEIEPYSNKMLVPLIKKKFNDKYANLTELQKKVIKLSINGTDDAKKEIYTTTIKECVELVNSQLQECTIEQKDTLLQVKDKLLRYEFESDKFASDMSEMDYLKTTLN